MQGLIPVTLVALPQAAFSEWGNGMTQVRGYGRGHEEV
jgi:hypothetical protein